MYHQCITNVSQMYHQCITNVSPMYHQCETLLLHKIYFVWTSRLFIIEVNYYNYVECLISEARLARSPTNSVHWSTVKLRGFRFEDGTWKAWCWQTKRCVKHSAIFLVLRAVSRITKIYRLCQAKKLNNSYLSHNHFYYKICSALF